MLTAKYEIGPLPFNPNVESVDLKIEPIDAVEIGAWAAKAHGMLSVAKKSLHFELPLYDVLVSSKARATYTDILQFFLNRTVSLLLIKATMSRRVSVADVIPSAKARDVRFLPTAAAF